MLAYSTLGQVGFILVAIGWGSELALVAALIYMFNHAFIKSALLMITGVIASYHEKHSANLKELTGAGKGLIAISILYLVGGLSLAGIPPLNGFMSKIALVRGGADVESWVVLGLVVGGGLLTLIYVTRTWQLIFVKPVPDDVVQDERPRHQRHGDSIFAPALLIGACILLGVFADPLVKVAEQTVAQISNPAIYTCAVLMPSIQLGIEFPEGTYDCAALAVTQAAEQADASNSEGVALAAAVSGER